jgi:hypothetical protein
VCKEEVMFKGLTVYLSVALLFAVIGLLGYIVLLTSWLNTAEHDLIGSQNQLESCSARIINIQEDIESDGKVNDLHNFDVPIEWMREGN